MPSKAVFLTAAVFSSIIFPFTAACQRQPPPPSAPPPGGRVVTPTRPDSIQDSGLYGYWTNMTQQGRAGGALLGKVTIEGEVLPWDPILVTVACQGNTMRGSRIFLTDVLNDTGKVVGSFGRPADLH